MKGQFPFFNVIQLSDELLLYFGISGGEMSEINVHTSLPLTLVWKLET